MSEITCRIVRELFSLDIETGVLRWRVDRGAKKVSGQVAGTIKTNYGYRQIGINGRNYAAHRIVWLHAHGEWPTGVIDHINGDHFDNRLSNLRDVPHQANMQNMRERHTTKKSGLPLGVFNGSRSKLRPFVASIRVNGKDKHLGRFATAEEAASAYIEAKRQLHAGCTI